METMTAGGADVRERKRLELWACAKGGRAWYMLTVCSEPEEQSVLLCTTWKATEKRSSLAVSQHHLPRGHGLNMETHSILRPPPSPSEAIVNS